MEPEKEKQPSSPLSTCKAVPVIDLGGTEFQDHYNDDLVVKQILEAGKEFGFFQVVNHGVPIEVIKDMMGVAEEFFEMPIQDKALYCLEDQSKFPILLTRNGNNIYDISSWRDCLRLQCYPVEEFRHQFPEKPSKFRENLARYATEAKRLATRLLKLISKGLGLDEDYFSGNLSKGTMVMNINHYAPCPDPSLTVGLPKHCDPNLITLLLQGNVSGLQVLLSGGEWVGVEPLPNAFVVNFGHMFEDRPSNIPILIQPITNIRTD